MRKIIGVLLLVICTGLSGCMPADAYRKEANTLCEYHCANDCATSGRTIAKTTKGQHYNLSFFELDDQGYLKNPYRETVGYDRPVPDYKKQILDAYRNIARTRKVLLLVYVHGWHHNANGDPEDNNITAFRKILAESADQLKDTEVLGIYIGWRGESVWVWPFDYINSVNLLTFWDRKNTAHEIGTQGLSELLLEIEDVVTSTEKSSGLDHTMVSIGHSFGGAALFSAVQPILADRFVKSRPFGSQNAVEGFGDMVVLLNPAFESVKYSGLFELSQYDCQSYPKTQKQRLVILSSAADCAVGWAFPLGRRVNTLLESHTTVGVTHCRNGAPEVIPLDSAYTDRYAVGHNRVYITHDLKPKKQGPENISAPESVNTSALFSIQTSTWATESESSSMDFGSTTLTDREVTMKHSPYFNIWTDKPIISGHNDIWTEHVKYFLYKLIGIADQ